MPKNNTVCAIFVVELSDEKYKIFFDKINKCLRNYIVCDTILIKYITYKGGDHMSPLQNLSDNLIPMMLTILFIASVCILIIGAIITAYGIAKKKWKFKQATVYYLSTSGVASLLTFVLIPIIKFMQMDFEPLTTSVVTFLPFGIPWCLVVFWFLVGFIHLKHDANNKDI